MTLYARSDDDAQGATDASRGRARRAKESPAPTSTAKIDAGTVAAARERLEQAAGRGTEALLAELTHTPPEIVAGIGGVKRVAELKRRAREADEQNQPA